MNETCKVCQHAKRLELEADLRRDFPLHRLALRYRTTKDAILGHIPHIAPDKPSKIASSSRRSDAYDAQIDEFQPHAPRQTQHVTTYPEFEVTVQLDDDRLGAANFQRQTVREIRDRWNLLDRPHQEEVVQWLRGRLTDALYEV